MPVYDIGLAGERSTLYAQVDVGTHLPANVPMPTVGIPVEIVDPTLQHSPVENAIREDDGMTGTHRSHERESAIHRPKLHIDTSISEAEHPLATHTDALYTSPDDMSPSEQPRSRTAPRPTSPPPSRGLRRSSAQVYSPSEVAARRQQRRTSAPSRHATHSPHHTYIPQPSNRPYPDYRLLEYRPTPSMNPGSVCQLPIAQHYADDNLGSNITQPSDSGTLDAEKYPEGRLEMPLSNSRYPSLPPRTSRSFTPPDRGGATQYPPGDANMVRNPPIPHKHKSPLTDLDDIS
ncbi:uncharacterized protein EV420DRAFT_1640546 [Desarmillaria tabescens]|uniref:Uncharacterized protein n=1 Tax=Armillaria tabescens TaxID=1929756 RepID=A0AA39N8M6_ARMTA|nr:uncharacterized protein EV420DRAFT_1640546 [Desarmillaria tabescens]KAK0461044.1 hypothetical protein EV420DRAFT_1640546 [Desarmillaria tabescens]